MMFTEHAFLDRFDQAAKHGFKAVEFLFPYDFEVMVIKERLTRNNLELVLFNISPGDWDGGARGLAAVKGEEAAFQTATLQALDYAMALDCPRLHAMAGLNTFGTARDIYLANLKYACAVAAPHGIEILIEPINSEDMPGYFLTHTSDAKAIIETVGAPNIGLQFDLYHRHKMEGDVGAAIASYSAITRHYQCAAPRDRGEPDRQDLDYQAVFEQIEGSGFSGWIGCEYRPRARTEDGLAWRSELLV